METSARAQERLGSERFEMYAETVASMEERSAEISVGIQGIPKANGYPQLDGIEAAYEHVSLKEEKEYLKERLAEIGEELAATDMPVGVWILHRRGDGKKDVRLRLDDNQPATVFKAELV